MIVVSKKNVPLIASASKEIWLPRQTDEEGVRVLEGFKQTGFVQGVESPAFARATQEIARVLFQRPFNQLLAHYDPKQKARRGYTPPFQEISHNSKGGLPDMKHFFDVPLNDDEESWSAPLEVEERIRGMCNGFRSRRDSLLRLLARGYQLDPDYFVHKTNTSKNSLMRILHYPSLRDTARLLTKALLNPDSLPSVICDASLYFLVVLFGTDDFTFLRSHDAIVDTLLVELVRAKRSERHFDMAFVTLLVSATGRGLKVRLPSRRWFSLGTRANRITFNIGNSGQRFTTFQFPGLGLPSVEHGVDNSDDTDEERFAVAVFVHLNDGVTLDGELTSAALHDAETKATIIS